MKDYEKPILKILSLEIDDVILVSTNDKVLGFDDVDEVFGGIYN